MTARRSPCSRTAMGSRSATVLEATPGAGPAGTVAVSIALLVRDSDARGGRHRARRLSQSKRGTNQVSGEAATDWRCSLCRLLGLLRYAAQRGKEQGLVDPAVENRDAHLHTLRDHLAPLHVDFVGELGGRQVYC